MIAPVGVCRLPSMSLWAWLSPTTFYTMRDGFRLYRSLVDDMHDDTLVNVTFGEYVKLKGFSKAYLETALLPMISMICTCTYEVRTYIYSTWAIPMYDKAPHCSITVDVNRWLMPLTRHTLSAITLKLVGLHIYIYSLLY
jgi:hypothetical protein